MNQSVNQPMGPLRFDWNAGAAGIAANQPVTTDFMPNLPGATGYNPNASIFKSPITLPAMDVGNVAGLKGPYKPSYDPSVTQKGGLTGWDKFNIGLNAVGTLGGLYLANEQLGQGREMFDWNKGVTSVNLENQAALTNLGLRERQVRRGLEQGLTSDQAAAAADKYVEEYGVRGKV